MQNRNRLYNALMALSFVFILAACGYRLLGKNVSWLDATYMTVVSLTSVGYTEVVDTSHSHVLRIFNMFVLVFGLGIMLYTFSVATAFVVEGDLHRIFWKKKMLKRIKALRNHTIICGAGTTGLRVIEELHKTHREMVVIDRDPARLERVTQLYGEIPVIEGDASDEDILEMAGLDFAGGVIPALPSDKDNLVVVVTVRQKHPNVRIVARCMDGKMADKMIRAGASSTVSPNSIGGMRLASEMIRPNVVTFLDMMLRDTEATLRIEEIPIPFHSSWVGHSLGEVRLRDHYKLSCLALREPGTEDFRYNPPDGERLRGNSVVVVIGNVDDIHSARTAASAQVVRRA
jgi:voltage-gated potassium channel